MGRCPECSAWDSLAERAVSTAPLVAAQRSRVSAVGDGPRVMTLGEIPDADVGRVQVPIGELGRVLGGGVVPGSLVLVGGDPGVGKSTLLVQLCEAVAETGATVMYLSGEESLSQIALRARRLGLASSRVLYGSENDLDSVVDAIQQAHPSIAIVDSIQSVSVAGVESSPGSVAQLRESATRLMHLAKSSGTAIFLVGHVTKEGAIAGPKVLEHLVDTVLYLEGERFHSYRLLRSTKNRFGPTHEVGVFEMRGEGMAEVPNPSAAFLAERGEPAPGSVVLVTLEGSRPILVEVQALVSRSSLAVPRRTANGIEPNRLLLVSAVLTRRMGLPLHDQDIYVNVAGGMRVDEPAADLAVALAIVSSFRDRAVPPDCVVAGEVGLSGETRGISQLEVRLREAAKLGFARAIVSQARGGAMAVPGMDVRIVSNVRQAVAAALSQEQTQKQAQDRG